jgi:hypothetical protein
MTSTRSAASAGRASLCARQSARRAAANDGGTAAADPRGFTPLGDAATRVEAALRSEFSALNSASNSEYLCAGGQRGPGRGEMQSYQPDAYD